jgi:hypothetical protein
MNLAQQTQIKEDKKDRRVWTQITKNRFEHVLAQITRDNFFSMEG